MSKVFKTKEKSPVCRLNHKNEHLCTFSSERTPLHFFSNLFFVKNICPLSMDIIIVILLPSTIEFNGELNSFVDKTEGPFDSE